MVETLERSRATWIEKARREGLLFPQNQVPDVGWKSAVMDDLNARLAGNSTFPCVFSLNAFKKGLVLFHFVEDASDEAVTRLAAALSHFVSISRTWDGSLATANPLVVAFSSTAICADSLKEYQAFGWNILQRIHMLDPSPWPTSVSCDPESSGWSMCFAGMPIFCNMSAPSHRRRRSRNLGSHFVMVINPRERFDVFAGDTKAGRLVRANIRRRLELYDEVPHSPQLAMYGAGGLEWPQYALLDDSQLDQRRCPFHASVSRSHSATTRPDRMTVEIVLSVGRIADRKAGLAEGARRTAAAIAQATGCAVRECGWPSAILAENWNDSLPAARLNLNELKAVIDAAMEGPGLPLLVATTCAASIVSLPLMAKRHPDACLLWIDAHGDFNTPETTGSGYLGGMVVAGACGLWDTGHGAGLDPSNVIVVGGRDIDPAEGRLLDTHGVTVLSPSAELLDRLVEAVGNRDIWIHIDWDVLDPGHVPADYAVPGGLLPFDVHAIFERFADRVLGVELTEYCVDDPSSTSDEHLASIVTMIEPVLVANRGDRR